VHSVSTVVLWWCGGGDKCRTMKIWQQMRQYEQHAQQLHAPRRVSSLSCLNDFPVAQPAAGTRSIAKRAVMCTVREQLIHRHEHTSTRSRWRTASIFNSHLYRLLLISHQCMHAATVMHSYQTSPYYFVRCALYVSSSPSLSLSLNYAQYASTQLGGTASR
jgi:hypothetical protein